MRELTLLSLVALVVLASGPCRDVGSHGPVSLYVVVDHQPGSQRGVESPCDGCKWLSYADPDDGPSLVLIVNDPVLDITVGDASDAIVRMTSKDEKTPVYSVVLILTDDGAKKARDFRARAVKRLLALVHANELIGLSTGLAVGSEQITITELSSRSAVEALAGTLDLKLQWARDEPTGASPPDRAI